MARSTVHLATVLQVQWLEQMARHGDCRLRSEEWWGQHLRDMAGRRAVKHAGDVAWACPCGSVHEATAASAGSEAAAASVRSGAALLGRSLRPRGASPGAGLLALATNEVMCSFFFFFFSISEFL